MLTFIIWIIEIINIVINATNAGNYFDIAKSLKSNSNSVNELSGCFRDMGAMCIINIIVSIIFCLAITIAYEKSKSNEDKIDSLLQKRKNNTKKTKDVEIEVDDDIDNVAKENECPICFNHINKNDKKCSKCGAKLK